MMENIKELFSRLIIENKKAVFKALADEFNLDLTYVKQHYIWAGKTPKEKQERVLQIVQNALIEQEKKTAKILG